MAQKRVRAKPRQKRIKSVQNNEVGEKKVKKDKKELTKREESDRIYARLRERYRESREDEERGNKNMKKLEKTSWQTNGEVI